jgi:FkbM family methyltransferase
MAIGKATSLAFDHNYTTYYDYSHWTITATVLREFFDSLEPCSATGAIMEDLSADHTTPSRMPDAEPPAFAFEYPKDAIVSYAQTHEDVLLWRALNNVHHGFYIDIGAYDPTVSSVTRAFYDRGWRGINVEPDRSYAAKLREERPLDVTLEVALGHSPGIATLYEFGDTGLSTLVKEIADEHAARGFTALERPISVTTLAAVLDDLGDQQVHFLKIDVEGFEQQVLLGADFAKVRPWIVLIEANRPMTTISTSRHWEYLLLEAGYEFAYFDGLNRFYIANERQYLKRFFSVPVSIYDPFRDSEVVSLTTAVAELERDKEAKASEIVRLAALVSDLQSDRMRLDVPSADGSSHIPVACDSQDTAELLRVVEAQTHDLAVLRGALVAARTMGAQSLEITNPETDAGDHLKGAEGQKVLESTYFRLFEEITRIEAAISDVVERSRWRRIGQRLGLAKRLAWEAGAWRMARNEVSGGSSACADRRTEERSLTELLGEFERLNGLLDQVRLSRWRKLGQWLGLAQRLPWESLASDSGAVSL